MSSESTDENDDGDEDIGDGAGKLSNSTADSPSADTTSPQLLIYTAHNELIYTTLHGKQHIKSTNE